MRKNIIFAALIVYIAAVMSGCSSEQSDIPEANVPAPVTKTVCASEYNVNRANALIEDIFKFVALIEGDNGEGKPYFCGARWTIWYGTTVKPDGTLISKRDTPVSREVGKEWCYDHLRRRVIPFFRHFTRKLEDRQIIGTALFMYNVGGENVTGYDMDGNPVQEASMYIMAVNQGKNDNYCVNCMTRYRKSAGKRANGLLKRHWVQGAAYKGILTTDNIMNLKPEQFYRTKDFGNYYWLNGKKKIIEKDGIYQLRFDSVTISTFFKMNTSLKGEKSVASITT